MPRRDDSQTSLDGPDTRTPSDVATPPRPRGAPSAPLPEPPPLPAPPRLPGGRRGPARGGRADGLPIDQAPTERIDRVERAALADPAPLPPSPGARDAERWLSQRPSTTGMTRLVSELDGPRDGRAGAAHAGAVPEPTLPTPRPLSERPWLVPALIAAVALTVGMILGALLAPREARCAPCAPAAQPKQ